MAENKINKYIRGIEQIDPLPIVSKKIVLLLADTNASTRKIVDLIENDPALSVKILKVANSAFYGTLSTVSSIDHALAILGINEIRAILLSISIRNFFLKKYEQSIDLNHFWIHSIICSQVAKYLSRCFKMPQNDTIFLSGLIHDIGKLVFDQYFHNEFIQITDYLAANKESFSKAEKAITGVTHYQVAAKLLQKWKFPEKVVMNVFFHHAPWHDSNGGVESALIYLANILTKMTGYTCHPAEKRLEVSQLVNSKAMKYLVQSGFDLDEDTIERLLNQIGEFIAAESQNVLNMFKDN